MRGFAIAIGILGLALPLVLLPATVASATDLTAGQASARFGELTGERLIVNRRASLPGRYVALDLGTPSAAKRARYGTFTVYVVTAADRDAQVADLLADGHTGAVGTAGLGGIHWEAGSTLRGERYWLAKRRYGANVVLWWIGTADRRQTDASFRRLHRPLTAVVGR